ncbi:MAG TPA: methyltransferase domain-containing protein [Gaiellaceae bacterium]|nr:methyltransferase domain-containing protein [Gaiellaceae bacterium]
MSSPATEPPDFGAAALSYDRLRPADDNWRELLEALVEEGDLRGRRVLDVGCGTGSVLAALVERHAARAWGVDPSPEMLEVARRRLPRGTAVRVGRAEELPFRDGWFDGALMRLVLHLVDRPAALAELRRVLRDDGSLVIATFDSDHFDGHWLNAFFPAVEEIDRARFPTAAELEAELEAAGFAAPRLRRLVQHASLEREEALTRIRGRYISTLRLLDDDEFEQGLSRAEAGLPARIDHELRWLVVATRARTGTA